VQTVRVENEKKEPTESTPIVNSEVSPTVLEKQSSNGAVWNK